MHKQLCLPAHLLPGGITYICHANRKGNVLSGQRVVCVDGDLVFVYVRDAEMKNFSVIVFRIKFRADEAQLLGGIVDFLGIDQAGIMRAECLVGGQKNDCSFTLG